MPPKKDQKQGGGSKVVADKTFGMKNKRGGKSQKVIASLQKQTAATGKTPAQREKERERELREKEKAEAEKRAKADAALLAQPVQKIPPGVDPKTVYCVYQKAGYCQKGNKCKFSHDPDVGRKVEKRDVYQDNRDDKANDTMDKWDEEKLRTVVNSKGNPRTTTDIVCKYFIEAIETEKFGWFWTCPNDEKEKNGCMYRHALPPGFVLKSQRKALDAAAKAANSISLEEFIEVERHKLGPNLTPVTAESFAKWKQTRQDKKLAEQEAIKAAKDAKAAAGKSVGMSGRDLFAYNPDWFIEEGADEDFDDDFDYVGYRREQQQREEERIAQFNAGFGENDADNSDADNDNDHDGSTVGTSDGGGGED